MGAAVWDDLLFQYGECPQRGSYSLAPGGGYSLDEDGVVSRTAVYGVGRGVLPWASEPEMRYSLT
jgi:hypothetical protein